MTAAAMSSRWLQREQAVDGLMRGAGGGGGGNDDGGGNAFATAMMARRRWTTRTRPSRRRGVVAGERAGVCVLTCLPARGGRFQY